MLLRRSGQIIVLVCFLVRLSLHRISFLAAAVEANYSNDNGNPDDHTDDHTFPERGAALFLI